MSKNLHPISESTLSLFKAKLNEITELHPAVFDTSKSKQTPFKSNLNSAIKLANYFKTAKLAEDWILRLRCQAFLKIVLSHINSIKKSHQIYQLDFQRLEYWDLYSIKQKFGKQAYLESAEYKTCENMLYNCSEDIIFLVRDDENSFYLKQNSQIQHCQLSDDEQAKLENFFANKQQVPYVTQQWEPIRPILAKYFDLQIGLKFWSAHYSVWHQLKSISVVLAIVSCFAECMIFAANEIIFDSLNLTAFDTMLGYVVLGALLMALVFHGLDLNFGYHANFDEQLDAKLGQSLVQFNDLVGQEHLSNDNANPGYVQR